MMNIPIVEDNNDFDCCVRRYRRAILNILHALKPKYSLEIGSHLFQSSAVWSYWIENNMPGGQLITCDIAKWTNSPTPDHVIQVMVYPHIDNISDFHGGINIYHTDKPRHGSIEANISAIENEMFGRWIESFNLTFVDGDHTETSFMADLRIAKRLTHERGYILIDDINDYGHEQIEVYKKLKQNNSFYEINGMALIKNDDFVL